VLAVSLGVVVVLALIACGVVGWLGAFGDLAVLGHPLGVMVGAPVAVGCMIAGQPAAALVPAALALGSLVAIVLPRVPRPLSPPNRPVRLASVNLQFDSPRPADAARNAIAIGADVLVVCELTDATDALLTPAFPYRIAIDSDDHAHFGQAVFSRLPIDDLAMPERVAGQVHRIRVGGDTPFVLYSSHVPRPALRRWRTPGLISFAGHRRAVDLLDRCIRAETEPAVLAGDLNLSDRASGYRTLIRGRRDVMRGRWPIATFHRHSGFWRMLSLRIDHLVVPSDWGARDGRAFDLDGSDHRGVIADIGPAAR
jgi:endonuclease/exonuclease/phosphatase (EEP) superfamily protein YafD